MDHRLVQAIRRIAEDAANAVPRPRRGVVASVNPAGPFVRVTLQPEAVLTGWLPVASLAASSGWGAFMLPAPGDQVQLIPDEGGGYTVTGAIHHDNNRPPSPPNAAGTGGTPSAASAPAQAGELILAHASGATIRLCADGSIYSRGAWHHDGPMTVNGTIVAQQDITTIQNLRAAVDVTDQNLAHGSLATLRAAYDAHEHPVVNVQLGAGTVSTGLTDHPVP